MKHILSKIIFLVTGTVLVVASAIGWITIDLLETSLEDGLRKQGVVLTENLAANSIPCFITDRFAPLSSYIESLAAQENVVYVMIRDNSGRIKAHNDLKRIGEVLTHDFALDTVENGKAYTRVSTDDNGVKFLDLSIPVLFESDPMGVAQIGYSLESLDVSAATARNHVFVLMLVGTGIGILLAVLFARFITGPIKKLREGAEIIGKGNLSYKVPIATRDEIGQFAESFNKMVDSVNKSYEELKNCTFIIDSVDSGVMLISSDHEILQTNRFLLERFGAVDGQKCYKYLEDRQGPCEHCALDAIYDKGEPSFSKEFTGKDKKIYGSTGSPIIVKGEMTVAEIISDITDRNLLEKHKNMHAEALEALNRSLESQVRERTAELRASEEKFRNLYENSRDIIFVLDIDGCITDISPSGERLMGLGLRELSTRNFTEFLHADNISDVRSCIKNVIVHGEELTLEVRLQRGNGSYFPVEIAMNPIYKDGNVVGVQGLGRDITERLQLKEQLLQAQKMEAIGTLAGGVAHDFNNLLGGILGYASVLKLHIDSLDKNYNYADQIQKAAERAAGLTKQLLAFSRKAKCEVKPIDLNTAVHNVLALIGRTVSREIEVSYLPADKLPKVEGDQGQLEQIIMNLCLNAADAMPHGGTLSITTASIHLDRDSPDLVTLQKKPGDYTLLTVEDSGIGINKETVSRIFEPFFTTKETGKGTGLGLSMVYGIVKNHGGGIIVHSDPGKGTTFKVYLPIVKEEKQEGWATKSYNDEVVSGTETIMVVDDEEIMRLMLKSVLDCLGYKVIVASDGKEAAEIYRLQWKDIDIAIIDIIMPVMDGGETFTVLKQINPQIKALLASGYTLGNGKVDKILNEGAQGFISKPFTVTDLSRKLRDILDNP